MAQFFPERLLVEALIALTVIRVLEGVMHIGQQISRCYDCEVSRWKPTK